VPELEQLCAGHAPAVLAFELANRASDDNAASRKVLSKTGFVPVGPAVPADLGGKSGTWYERDLPSG
jgi:[ribosomal protein S5]-alanine N-acetyltransferase